MKNNQIIVMKRNVFSSANPEIVGGEGWCGNYKDPGPPQCQRRSPGRRGPGDSSDIVSKNTILPKVLSDLFPVGVGYESPTPPWIRAW